MAKVQALTVYEVSVLKRGSFGPVGSEWARIHAVQTVGDWRERIDLPPIFDHVEATTPRDGGDRWIVRVEAWKNLEV